MICHLPCRVSKLLGCSTHTGVGGIDYPNVFGMSKLLHCISLVWEHSRDTKALPFNMDRDTHSAPHSQHSSSAPAVPRGSPGWEHSWKRCGGDTFKHQSVTLSGGLHRERGWVNSVLGREQIMESGCKTTKTIQAGIWEASSKPVSWHKHLSSWTPGTFQKIQGEVPGLPRAQGKAAEGQSIPKHLWVWDAHMEKCESLLPLGIPAIFI